MAVIIKSIRELGVNDGQELSKHLKMDGGLEKSWLRKAYPKYLVEYERWSYIFFVFKFCSTREEFVVIYEFVIFRIGIGLIWYYRQKTSPSS